MGVPEKLSHSQWAHPIAPVVKTDNIIPTYANAKVTVQATGLGTLQLTPVINQLKLDIT